MYATNKINSVDNKTVIDLRSDTVSKPDEGMKQAMFAAVLGDDVYGEDPTANELERKSAELFGKEAALFVPTGTMANLLAVMVHCNNRGSEAIVGHLAHVFLYEQGGAAYLAGVLLNVIENNPDGTFSLEGVKSRIRGWDFHEPRTSLVLVENTHNICGGKVLPLDWLEELSKICKDNSMKLHMDGARIFNASASSGVPVSRIVRDVDSVCFCMSKGLSCPVGSVLIGTTEFIGQARRLRKALGGGMRQIGLLAAAGIYAIDNIVPRLSQDHEQLRRIANAIHNLNSPLFKIDLENVKTNILMIYITTKKFTSTDFAQRLLEIRNDEVENGIVDDNGNGIVVKISSRDWSFSRIVIYTEVTDAEVDLTIKKLLYVIKEFESQFG